MGIAYYNPGPNSNQRWRLLGTDARLAKHWTSYSLFMPAWASRNKQRVALSVYPSRAALGLTSPESGFLRLLPRCGFCYLTGLLPASDFCDSITQFLNHVDKSRPTNVSFLWAGAL